MVSCEKLMKFFSKNPFSTSTNQNELNTCFPRRPLVADPATPHMKTHVVSLHRSESSTPLFNMESAGFQQCVAQLTSYIQKITPSQRSSLIEGLKHHAESQQPNNSEPDFGQRGPETEAAKQLTSVDSICTSEGKEESTKSSFLSLSPFQPHLCSTPCHDYVSPPPSPWLSPSFSTYATSPPFSSFAPQFSSSPHSLSPLSSNTSFFSFSHTTPHSGPPALHCPPLTMLRPSPHAAPREWSPPNSSSSPMWRPWF